MMLVTEITACRSCGSERLETVLNLGELMISDFILPGEPEESAPLELVCCLDCSLVQLRHTVDRDRLYRDNYYYKSSTNESMVAALKDVVEDAMRRVKLEIDDQVLDVGCNDGTLLSFYPSYVDCYGYEPAINLHAEAKKKSRGCIYPDYFPSKKWWLPQKYKVITAIAQLYNVNDVNAYVAAIKDCLHKDGIWIVQFQDLEGMLGCNGVDNICHEHLMYFDYLSFKYLVSQHGLRIADSSRNQTNGSSARYIIEHDRSGCQITSIFNSTPEGLAEFSEEVERNKADTLDLLRSIKAEGKTVLGVAASTKANTLLQFYGVTPDLLPAIVDRNPDKVGRVMVGTHIPIVGEEEIQKQKPDYLLALAWHFFDSFQKRYADFEGKWIVPLPELRIIGGEKCPSIPEEHYAKA